MSPERFTINNTQSKIIEITIESTAPIGVQQFWIRSTSRQAGPVLHLPVAYIHTQGNVALTQSCWQTSIPRGQATVCDVTGDQQLVRGPGRRPQQLRVEPLQIIGANGATIDRQPPCPPT